MNTKSSKETNEIELPVKIVAQYTVLGSIYPLTPTAASDTPFSETGVGGDGGM